MTWKNSESKEWKRTKSPLLLKDKSYKNPHWSKSLSSPIFIWFYLLSYVLSTTGLTEGELNITINWWITNLNKAFHIWIVIPALFIDSPPCIKQWAKKKKKKKHKTAFKKGGQERPEETFFCKALVRYNSIPYHSPIYTIP